MNKAVVYVMPTLLCMWLGRGLAWKPFPESSPDRQSGVTEPFTCDFEKEHLCGMIQPKTDDADFHRVSAKTVDYTIPVAALAGEHYMAFSDKASSINKTAKDIVAGLDTPNNTFSTNYKDLACIEFYYFVHEPEPKKNVSRLNVHTFLSTNLNETLFDTGSKWMLFHRKITSLGSGDRLFFEARNYNGLIGVDHLRFSSEPCGEIDHCESEPCSNGGTCHNIIENGEFKFSCVCTYCYSGLFCESPHLLDMGMCNVSDPSARLLVTDRTASAIEVTWKAPQDINTSDLTFNIYNIKYPADAKKYNATYRKENHGRAVMKFDNLEPSTMYTIQVLYIVAGGHILSVNGTTMAKPVQPSKNNTIFQKAGNGKVNITLPRDMDSYDSVAILRCSCNGSNCKEYKVEQGVNSVIVDSDSNVDTYKYTITLFQGKEDKKEVDITWPPGDDACKGVKDVNDNSQDVGGSSKENKDSEDVKSSDDGNDDQGDKDENDSSQDGGGSSKDNKDGKDNTDGKDVKSGGDKNDEEDREEREGKKGANLSVPLGVTGAALAAVLIGVVVVIVIRRQRRPQAASLELELETMSEASGEETERLETEDSTEESSDDA